MKKAKTASAATHHLTGESMAIAGQAQSDALSALTQASRAVATLHGKHDAAIKLLTAEIDAHAATAAGLEEQIEKVTEASARAMATLRDQLEGERAEAKAAISKLQQENAALREKLRRVEITLA